ncbi:hypothetical protein RI129_001900 [Pyrocoelia pectoralis]|uniref:Ankyrin repeat protein n=1 Tax=Pyrocoelia pectoralis TaxID=417401 RepID=A0AAN7ZXR7_9COLE
MLSVIFAIIPTVQSDIHLHNTRNSEYVDSKTKEGDTALHLSIKRGYHNITTLLLERGANINSKDQDGNTPTHKAVLFNYPNILKMLIQRKADINIANDAGEFPLLTAVTNEYLDLVQILVEGNAIINCDTALHLSIKRGYYNITRLLLERGANINSKDQDGNTPTHKAVLFNYPNILKMLIQRKADINIPNDAGEFPLLTAVTNEYLDLVQILVEGNAIINCCNDTNKNPLAVAIRQDNTAILKLFFEKGVKANDKIGGAPLLQLAVLNASVDVTRFLLEHGADYTFKTEDGETLLYLAIYNDFTNLAELILTVTTVAPPPNGLHSNVEIY